MSEEKQKTEEVYTAENADAEADTIFGSTLEHQEAPASGAGTSRNIRWLIVGICALVLLGGGLTATILLSRKNEPEPTLSSAEAGIQLNPYASNDVTSIDIRGKENYTVSLRSQGENPSDSTYGIDGYDDVTLDANLLSTLIYNGNALASDSTVAETGADLAVFGLAEPAADVTMHYVDGSTFSFSIGDAAPTGAAQNYVCVNGSVYLVRTSLVANFQKTPAQFVSTTLLPEPAQSDYPIIESVTVERKDLDYDIVLEYDHEGADDAAAGGSAATHVMTSPIYAFLNPDKSTKITHGLFGLTAIEVSAVHPTEADYAAKGLKDPFCTVTTVCDDGNTHTLWLGDEFETELGAKCRYARFDDAPVIYGVTQEDAAWGSFMPDDITSASIFVTMVWHISKLDVQQASGNVLFEGTGDDKDNYVVTKNGAPCDTERFRKFYHFLLSIYGEEMYYDAIPETDPDVQIHLQTQDGKEDYTIAFYQLSEMKTLVVRGNAAYVIRTSCLNTLRHNLEIIDDPSQEISLTWQ